MWSPPSYSLHDDDDGTHDWSTQIDTLAGTQKIDGGIFLMLWALETSIGERKRLTQCEITVNLNLTPTDINA